MKRAGALCLFGLCLSAGRVPAQQPPAPTPSPAPAWRPFQEFAFLTGAWSGPAESSGRIGGCVIRFGTEAGGSYFVQRGGAVFTAEDARPEETVEIVGYFAYDRVQRRYVATYFFSTGVFGTYDAEIGGDGSVRLVSQQLSNYQPGAKARIVLGKKSDTQLSFSIEIAPDGTAFVPYLTSDLKKK